MKRLEDVLQELRVEYLQCLPQRVILIQKLMAAQDWKRLETEFHKLKGTGKTYGISEVSTLSAELETYSMKSGCKDLRTCELYCALLTEITTRATRHETTDLSNHPLFIELKKLIAESSPA